MDLDRLFQGVRGIIIPGCNGQGWTSHYLILEAVGGLFQDTCGHEWTRCAPTISEWSGVISGLLLVEGDYHISEIVDGQFWIKGAFHELFLAT